MYLNRDFLLGILFFLSRTFKQASSQRAAQKLMNDLFKDYDPYSRPVLNSTHITEVCVGLYILQIVNLSEKNQVIEANIQLLYIWVRRYPYLKKIKINNFS